MEKNKAKGAGRRANCIAQSQAHSRRSINMITMTLSIATLLLVGDLFTSRSLVWPEKLTGKRGAFVVYDFFLREALGSFIWCSGLSYNRGFVITGNVSRALPKDQVHQ